jgi:16S rRNA C967 or C1407 C5-methylase (RsmB/RsmF family)/NOL1/NOP2/fmu family ribosome biogenesis protein
VEERKKIPAELIRSLQEVSGFNRHTFADVHENNDQVTSVRVNPSKVKSDPALLFPGSEKVPWSSMGYYLPSRPYFTFDPRLHAGAYYVQEPSSMFLEVCLRQTSDLSKQLKVLDLCAAPGGKSTLIQSVISFDSLLVSNEVIKTRVGVLVENLSKWGGANVIVTNNDPRDFSNLENYFDVLVVDAPCSGSGLFRRDANAIDEWSPETVHTCSLRQQRILADAYPCLKQGGVLIYSTCSYSAEEDEEIGDWLLLNYKVHSIKLDVPAELNIVETKSNGGAFGYRFFPDRLRGEGFYISCFIKNDGEGTSYLKARRGKVMAASAAEKKLVLRWVEESSFMNFYYVGEEIFAFPAALENDLLVIKNNLHVKKAGITVGKLARNEVLPAHELAVSGIANKKLFTISLKKDEALQYLRKEEVKISTAHRGWAIVEFEGFPLGWVKVLGNRTNNYYPKEWRILKRGINE